MASHCPASAVSGVCLICGAAVNPICIPRRLCGGPVMNCERGLQTWPTPRPLRAATQAALPILIEIPLLHESLQSQVRKTVRARPRSTVGRPRRRLRREVRIAGYGVLLMGTLAWVSPALRGVLPMLGSTSDGAVASRGVLGAAQVVESRPTVSISIEPAALAPYAEAESPVVFPGYLLPDDSGEEPAHAGS
jgi:hypothetical protein